MENNEEKNKQKPENNVIKEMQDSMGGDMIKGVLGPLLGKIKPFIPMALKGLETSDEFLKQDETIVIGKNKDNKFVILKGKGINYTLKSEEDKNNLQKISLGGLVEQLLGMIVEKTEE